jgi:hypothetical protein
VTSTVSPRVTESPQRIGLPERGAFIRTPDDEHPEWNAEERAFAAAWRKQPKWVVSRSLKSVGPNARLVGDDLEGATPLPSRSYITAMY